LYVRPEKEIPMRRTPKPTLTGDRASDGAYVVYALTADGVLALGTYANVADAWTAIDALDSPDEHLALAAGVAMPLRRGERVSVAGPTAN
jgi:hypothetical protein